MNKINPKISSVAVSIGEPAGIGPDILLQAWTQRDGMHLPHFTAIGDVDFLKKRAKLLHLDVPLSRIKNGAQALEVTDALPVLATQYSMNCQPAKPDTANCAGVIEAIERGAELVMAGEFSALLTCPIHKKTLYDSGFDFAGHTEFLASVASRNSAKPVVPVMMLAGPQLRTVPVTVHIALREVAHQLSTELILRTARITARDLTAKFGIKNPVLAIAGLNPHAGEEGAMGDEDAAIILPAIRQLQDEGIRAVGPLPADTMFHQQARDTYDVAICMYHDQALIPAKTLGFDDAVNVTLGLPFVRTSPDHGTAFDIAGTGKARVDSFVAALRMAAQMAQNQAAE